MSMKCLKWANPQRQSRLAVARGWGRGERGVTANGYRVSFGGDENILELDSGDGYKTL